MELTHMNKKIIKAANENYLLEKINNYLERGWEVKGRYVQTNNGMWGCVMIRKSKKDGGLSV